MTFHGAGFKYSVTPAHTQTSLLSDSEDDNVLPWKNIRQLFSLSLNFFKSIILTLLQAVNFFLSL